MKVWILENGDWTEESFDSQVHYLCPECTEDEGEDTYHIYADKQGATS